MPTETICDELSFQTRGFTDIIDITPEISSLLSKNNVASGLVNLFVPGSTAAITTIEYEPGLLKDLPEFLEEIIPQDRSYNHDKTWGDGNGYAHLRAALIGPSLSVPIQSGRMTLGTWQQIVLIDFDNRPRQRRLVIQVLST
jgi:secondary thiamine-phosphate synthase enzyme